MTGLIGSMIGCGIVVIDPMDGTGGSIYGGSDDKCLPSDGTSVASSTVSSSSTTSGGEESCVPGQLIPGSDGGPDGGLTLCCSAGKTLCLDICCQEVIYKPDGTIDSEQFCAANKELGYCCEDNFVCIKL